MMVSVDQASTHPQCHFLGCGWGPRGVRSYSGPQETPQQQRQWPTMVLTLQPGWSQKEPRSCWGCSRSVLC
jgi:hypothetical protein